MDLVAAVDHQWPSRWRNKGSARRRRRCSSNNRNRCSFSCRNNDGVINRVLSVSGAMLLRRTRCMQKQPMQG